MINKYKEIDKELGKHKKTNEMQDALSDRIDAMLSYGPYSFGLNHVNSESSAEERIQKDLEK
jgi:hypothetical protein